MIDKKCNKHLDCEDGTDEENCTCRDYLLNFQPTAICDGHLDCDDETDEKNCGIQSQIISSLVSSISNKTIISGICKDDEFHCSRSVGCIPMTKRCDANFDCPLREDEVDCRKYIRFFSFSICKRKMLKTSIAIFSFQLH